MTLEELAAPEFARRRRMRRRAKFARRPLDFLAARAVTAQVNDALENFRFHEAAHVVYHFFWGDFCDWYIEWVKPATGLAGSRRRDRDVEKSFCGV